MKGYSQTNGINGSFSTASHIVSFTNGLVTSITTSSAPPRCLIAGTQVEMADGTFSNIEDLITGDVVKSVDIPSMPDTDNAAMLATWSTQSLGATFTTAIVTGNEAITVDMVYSINNGLLTCSSSHLHIIERNGTWYVKQTSDLLGGDYLLSEDNFTKIEITSIDSGDCNITGHTVYNLDVENDDVYIANGIVTHNRKAFE